MSSISRNPQLLSDIDIYVPIDFISYTLPANLRDDFNHLKDYAHSFILNNTQFTYQQTHAAKRNDLLLKIIDQIQVAGVKQKTNEFLKIMKCFVEYLRIHLLSKTHSKVYNAILIQDALVKNCDYRVHLAIHEFKNMKTLSKVARRQLTDGSASAADLGTFLTDTIQAWGEAFEQRILLYPNIPDTYQKLRWKHGCRFIRPDYDPTRVPIFLPPITKSQEEEIQQYHRNSAQQFSTNNNSNNNSKQQQHYEDYEVLDTSRESDDLSQQSTRSGFYVPSRSQSMGTVTRPPLTPPMKPARPSKSLSTPIYTPISTPTVVATVQNTPATEEDLMNAPVEINVKSNAGTLYDENKLEDPYSNHYPFGDFYTSKVETQYNTPKVQKYDDDTISNVLESYKIDFNSELTAAEQETHHSQESQLTKNIYMTPEILIEQQQQPNKKEFSLVNDFETSNLHTMVSTYVKDNKSSTGALKKELFHEKDVIQWGSTLPEGNIVATTTNTTPPTPITTDDPSGDLASTVVTTKSIELGLPTIKEEPLAEVLDTEEQVFSSPGEGTAVNPVQEKEEVLQNDTLPSQEGEEVAVHVVTDVNASSDDVSCTHKIPPTKPARPMHDDDNTATSITKTADDVAIIRNIPPTKPARQTVKDEVLCDQFSRSKLRHVEPNLQHIRESKQVDDHHLPSDHDTTIISTGDNTSTAPGLSTAGQLQQNKARGTKTSGFVDPASDPNVEVRFFGNQRVLVRKPSSNIPKYF